MKAIPSREIQHLIERIDLAFEGVTLGSGVGLLEADGIDDRDDAEALAAHRSDDEKDDWRLIPTERLDRCCSMLTYCDAEGMRFNLPAFLVADLRGDYDGWCNLEFVLCAEGENMDGKFSLLSDEQRAVTRDYLLHLLEDEDTYWFRDPIITSLEGRWKI